MIGAVLCCCLPAVSLLSPCCLPAVSLLCLSPSLCMYVPLSVTVSHTHSLPAACSLYESSPFTISRVTQTKGITANIPYWVKTDFGTAIGSRREGLRRVEEAVEQSFYSVTKRKCAGDRQRKSELQHRIVGSRGTMRSYLEKQVGRDWQLPPTALRVRRVPVTMPCCQCDWRACAGSRRLDPVTVCACAAVFRLTVCE